MQPAEIETFVDEEVGDVPCTVDRRQKVVRRRRMWLVPLVSMSFLLIVAVSVAAYVFLGNSEQDELPKTGDSVNTQQAGAQNSGMTPPTGTPPTIPPPTGAAEGAPPTQAPPPLSSSTTTTTGAPPTNAQSSPTQAPPTAAPPPSQETSQSEALATWLDANVTLSSGPMFEVLRQIQHDADAFTQGLTFAKGRLFESTGLNGHSTIRELDPDTGEVLVSVPLDHQYFGEGLAYANDELVQITWKKRTAFVYNPNDLTIPPKLHYFVTTKNNEGWGITHDPVKNEFIVSDGSANLVFWDVITLKMKQNRTMSIVRQNGEPATDMNELEFWRGRILANVWYEDVILVIHPETGVVEKEYDFSTLWPKSDRPHGTNVFNGISVSDEEDALFVTGKQWNRMYKIKLLP